MMSFLASVDMNINDYEEDSEDTKEDNGVDEYGSATCLHVPKLHHSTFGWNLKQKPWT